MSISGLNHFAIILSAIISLGLGFFWMTFLFAKPYGKYMYGVEHLGKENQNVAPKQQAYSFAVYILFSIITSYVFAIGLRFFNNEIFEAIQYTILVWVGFFVPFAVNKVVWQEKRWIVAFIDSSYEIVRLILTMLILFYWR